MVANMQLNLQGNDCWSKRVCRRHVDRKTYSFQTHSFDATYVQMLSEQVDAGLHEIAS